MPIPDTYNILGIDPGLARTGWGVIRIYDHETIEYVDCGVLRTSANRSMESRISFIFDKVCDTISEFSPDAVAMEEVFVNINPKTSEKLIMARTAAFLAIVKSEFKVYSYRPNEIKKNVTGSGHASKDHVSTMVQKILRTPLLCCDAPDAVDALSVALCHAFGEVTCHRDCNRSIKL
jgi:crossover junction endodeoxyribonuclease RuvC